MLTNGFHFARTLHGRLVLALLLIGIVPLGLIGVGIAILDSRSIGEQSARELIGLARGLAGQLDIHMTGLLEDSRAMAALADIAGMNPARQEPVLKELFHHRARFARLSTFDRSGRLVASSHPGTPASIAMRESFKIAAESGRQAWMVETTLSTRRSSLLIHTPVRDAERRVVGVLGAVVDLEDLSAALGRVHVGGGSQAFVLDASGRVLLHEDGAAVQKRLDYSWIGIPAGGRPAGPGTVRYDAAGESRVAGYAAIPNTGWTVLVERPEAEILMPAKRSLRLALAGLAMSVTLAMVAAAFFALKLTRPVRELTRAAQAMAAGNLSLPPPPVAAKESDLGVLIRSFDAMRKAVETREEALRGNLQRIRILREIDAAITSTLDLHAVLDVLLEKIDLVLPYAAAAIRLFNKENGLLEPVASRNIDEKAWRAEPWRGGRGIQRLVFESRTPQTIRNIYADPRMRDLEFFRKHGLVSYLGVPLIAKGETLGVLSVYTKEEHEFSNDEVEFLSTLAAQASIAIQNARLYEEMAKVAGDLARSNRVKDEFLGVMSHELRTPLNVIMGYIGLMGDGLLGAVGSKQREALNKMLGQAKDQLAMVNNILQTTQSEAGADRIERHGVLLGEFLESLKSEFDLPLDKDLELIWDYPSDLPLIYTDSGKLKQILQNLINNALKFTERGTVSVSVRHLAEAKTVSFAVADTGIGIPEESIPVVFEMFRQVDSSETRAFGGVGLGLYIVRKFVDLLGGQIEVQSEIGKGSVFTVRIPETLEEELIGGGWSGPGEPRLP